MRDIKSGKFLAYKVDHSFLSSIGAIQSWFLGIMASDGCIHPLNRFVITQSGPTGFQTIRYIKDILKFEGNILHYENSHILSITSPLLVKELARYNILPKKTLSYKFPVILNKENIRNFIRGYIDGDGCIGVYKSRRSRYLHTSVVGTKSFIDHLQKEIRETPESSLIEIKRCKNLWELRWNGKRAIDFCQWLFSDSFVYKSSKYDTFVNYMSSRDDKYTRYIGKKALAKNLLTKMSFKNVSEEMSISQGTLYKWREKGII